MKMISKVCFVSSSGLYISKSTGKSSFSHLHFLSIAIAYRIPLLRIYLCYQFCYFPFNNIIFFNCIFQCSKLSVFKNPAFTLFPTLQAENGVQIQNIYDEGTILHRYNMTIITTVKTTHPRGSVEDTTAFAGTNSTGYTESVLGAGVGSNGKVDHYHYHLCQYKTNITPLIRI